jgi:hypothetical protein
MHNIQSCIEKVGALRKGLIPYKKVYTHLFWFLLTKRGGINFSTNHGDGGTYTSMKSPSWNCKCLYTQETEGAIDGDSSYQALPHGANLTRYLSGNRH